jgi:hypothetical protein
MNKIKIKKKKQWASLSCEDMPVIPATLETKTGGSQVRGQPRQFSEILSRNKIRKGVRVKLSGREHA